MMKKLLSVTSTLLKGTLFIILCFLVVAVLSTRFSDGGATLFGYQVKAVLSGSMEPTLQTGSILSIKVKNQPSHYKKKEIITFQMGDKLITHRIIALNKVNGEITYQTKGDNNDAPDLWTVSREQIIGQYSGITIPYIGFALSYAGTKAGSALLLIIPGIFLTLSAVRTFLLTKKEIDQKMAG